MVVVIVVLAVLVIVALGFGLLMSRRRARETEWVPGSEREPKPGEEWTQHYTPRDHSAGGIGGFGGGG